MFGESVDDGFVALMESLQRGLFLGSLRSVGLALLDDGDYSANDAAARFFGFVKNWEGGAKAELFGIPGVDAGDERADEAIEQRRGEFASDEGADRFVRLRGFTLAEEVAEDRAARAAAHERRGDDAGAHGDSLEFSINQDITRGFGIGENALFEDAKVFADGGNGAVAAEALRTAFEEIAIAADRLNHAARARGGFDDAQGDAALGKRVSTGEAGNAGTDDESFDPSGHVIALSQESALAPPLREAIRGWCRTDGAFPVARFTPGLTARATCFAPPALQGLKPQPLRARGCRTEATLKGFGKERPGGELLLFKIRIKDHGQVANEDAAQPGGADFLVVEDNQTILLRHFEAFQFWCEIFVKIDGKLFGDFVFDDDRVAEKSADDFAAD